MSGIRITPALDGLLSPMHGKHSDVAMRVAIKFALLADGLQLDDSAQEWIREGAPGRPRRTRSGVSGGLDIDLGNGIIANAPVLEGYVANSSLTLSVDPSPQIVTSDGSSVPVQIVPPPNYYRMETDEGVRLEQIGQMCSPDRFCFGITGPGCSFWPRADRCKYCSIGDNGAADLSRKTIQLMLRTLAEALEDASRPARHILLGGGTPRGDDMGAKVCAELAREIKAIFDVPIYVMIAAPLDNSEIDRLADAGVDELGMNLEFWSNDAWDAFIPGKARRIGKIRYLDALEHAAKVFGPVRSRSILIAGLEPADQTLVGVDELSSRGIMPIISPFRPLSGTMLEDRRGFTADAYQELFVEAVTRAGRYGLPIGPVCTPCQNNVLAVPETLTTPFRRGI